MLWSDSTMLSFKTSCLFFLNFSQGNKHELKISDRLRTGDQIILNLTENFVFQNIKLILQCFYLYTAINLSSTEQIGTTFKSTFSCWLYSFPMLSAHYTFCLFLSQHLVSFWYFVILPAKYICQLKHQSPKAIK